MKKYLKYIAVAALGVATLILNEKNKKLSRQLGRLEGENANLKDLNAGLERNNERLLFNNGKLRRLSK